MVVSDAIVDVSVVVNVVISGVIFANSVLVVSAVVSVTFVETL